MVRNTILHSLNLECFNCYIDVSCQYSSGIVYVTMTVLVLQATNKKQKYERISEKKMSTPVEVLCKVSFLHATIYY